MRAFSWPREVFENTYYEYNFSINIRKKYILPPRMYKTHWRIYDVAGFGVVGTSALRIIKRILGNARLCFGIVVTRTDQVPPSLENRPRHVHLEFPTYFTTVRFIKSHTRGRWPRIPRTFTGGTKLIYLFNNQTDKAAFGYETGRTFAWQRSVEINETKRKIMK